MTARALAIKALVRVGSEGAYSNLVMDGELEHSGLEGRERAFAVALFYGTLERLITLDACVERYSTMKMAKLSKEVLAILRVSLYQLLYMPQVPSYAVVNEAVKLTRAVRQTSAGSFVNGVLRAFLRDGGKIPLPEGELPRLSVAYGMPQPLLALLVESYGKEQTLRFLEQCAPPTPVYLRVNTTKTTAEELAALLAQEGMETVATGLENCLELRGGGDIRRLEAFTKGLFHVQDFSSQLCAKALEAAPGMRVLDVCAAPGGKSFTIAQHMADQGELVALDLHPGRVGLIQQGAARLGLGCIQAGQGDAAEFHPDRGLFDRVLCDVPCSGYGILRRKPEIRYKPLSEGDQLPAVQYKILEESAKYSKVGGLVVYSTCTLNPKENEKVVERFLAAHPGFRPRGLGVLGLEAWHVTLMGTPHNCDGFFIAALEKTEA